MCRWAPEDPPLLQQPLVHADRGPVDVGRAMRDDRPAVALGVLGSLGRQKHARGNARADEEHADPSGRRADPGGASCARPRTVTEQALTSG